jgi:hypothetical protein
VVTRLQIRRISISTAMAMKAPAGSCFTCTLPGRTGGAWDVVDVDDPIGHPSCEGRSTGTPCTWRGEYTENGCRPLALPFVLSGWRWHRKSLYEATWSRENRRFVPIQAAHTPPSLFVEMPSSIFASTIIHPPAESDLVCLWGHITHKIGAILASPPHGILQPPPLPPPDDRKTNGCPVRT